MSTANDTLLELRRTSPAEGTRQFADAALALRGLGALDAPRGHWVALAVAEHLDQPTAETKQRLLELKAGILTEEWYMPWHRQPFEDAVEAALAAEGETNHDASSHVELLRAYEAELDAEVRRHRELAAFFRKVGVLVIICLGVACAWIALTG